MVDAPVLKGFHLVAYAIEENTPQPYGYMMHESEPEGFPEPVLIEGAVFDERTKKFHALIKRPGKGVSLDHDPEKVWAILYSIGVAPEEVTMLVGAQAFADGSGRACYPMDFEKRLAYRHYFEAGEDVSEEWREHYKEFVYQGKPWPGFLEIEGGRA